MVGVPGRSRACNTCRQRKIACSLERPQCAQCIKSKRPCAGYRRELIFISSHKQVEAVQTITTREPPFETDGTQKPMRKEHDKTLCLMSSQAGLAHPTTMTSGLEVLPKRVLPASVYKQQFLNLFICSYIPDDMLNVSRVGRCIFWVPLLLEMPNVPRALEISMLAVCTAKVGRLNGDQALVQESLRLYIRGICELQKALWNPQLMYKDETLAACMALCIYEVLECPQRSGVAYVAHSNGALRLLQLRGAGAHTQGLGHALFLAFRLHGTLQALGLRHPNFLSDQAWLEQPWKHTPKSHFDLLIDILLKIPDVFRKVDESQRLESQVRLLALLEIVNLLWAVDADLERWYKNVENSVPVPLFSTKFSTMESPADDPEGGKLFPIAFHFSNLMVAHALTLYWSGQVMVWCTLTRAYRSIRLVLDQGTIEDAPGLSSVSCSFGVFCTCNDEGKVGCTEHFDIRQLRPLEHRSDWPQSAARNIFQSVEYCLKDEMLGIGPNTIASTLMFTVIRLLNVPGDWRREFLFVDAVLTRIHGRGSALYKFFNGDK